MSFAGPMECRAIFSMSARALNRNAVLAASDYRFEHTRLLGDYHFFLGPSFRQAAENLKPKDLSVDLGGGLGVAHLELMVERGHRAIVINKQNFPAHWAKALARLKDEGANAVRIGHEHRAGEMFPDMYWIESVGGLARGDVARVATALGFELPRWLEKPRSTREIKAGEVRELAVMILEKHQSLMNDPRFEYRAQFAEDALKNLKGQARLLSDVFGAFFYSAERVHLLEAIDRAMADGESRAFVSLVGFVERGVSDRVRMKDGRELDLIDFLLERFPERFAIEGSRDPQKAAFEPPALIIKKGDSPLELHLTVETHLEAYEKNGLVIPRTLYSSL